VVGAGHRDFAIGGGDADLGLDALLERGFVVGWHHARLNPRHLSPQVGQHEVAGGLPAAIKRDGGQQRLKGVGQQAIAVAGA
jgi:hypothetical protein